MDLQSVGLDLLLIASIFAGFHIMGDWVRGYALWEHHLKTYLVRKSKILKLCVYQAYIVQDTAFKQLQK